MSEAYSYSLDGERYHGKFSSIDEACLEAFHEAEVGTRFWIGRNVPPTPPEDIWCADDWLEHVSVQDDYHGEWAEDWDDSTKEQRTELETEVRAVLARWLERHDLRPTFWNVEEISEYQVTAKGECEPVKVGQAHG